MMSLSELRRNLFKTFEFMREGHATIEFYHRRKVYRMNIQETGERYTMPYKKRAKGVPEGMLTTAPCPDCDSLLVNGVCMNSKCPGH